MLFFAIRALVFTQAYSIGKIVGSKYKMTRLYRMILTVVMFFFMASYAYAYDMTLAWDPNLEMDIVSYNLYVSVDNSGSYSLVDEITLDEVDPDNPQFMVTDMESNVTYDFAVTAINSAGLESYFSNEVSVLNGQALAPVVSSGGSDVAGGGCFISASFCGVCFK